MHFDVNVVFTKRFSIYLSNLLCKLNFSSLRLLISNVVTKTDNKTRFQINTINILLVFYSKNHNICKIFKSKLLRDLRISALVTNRKIAKLVRIYTFWPNHDNSHICDNIYPPVLYLVLSERTHSRKVSSGSSEISHSWQ